VLTHINNKFKVRQKYFDVMIPWRHFLFISPSAVYVTGAENTALRPWHTKVTNLTIFNSESLHENSILILFILEYLQLSPLDVKKV